MTNDNPFREGMDLARMKTVAQLARLSDGKNATDLLDTEERAILDYLLTRVRKGERVTLTEAVAQSGMSLSEFRRRNLGPVMFILIHTYLDEKGMGLFDIIDKRIEQAQATRTVVSPFDGSIVGTYPDWSARQDGLEALENLSQLVPRGGKGVTLNVDKSSRSLHIHPGRNIYDEIVAQVGVKTLDGSYTLEESKQESIPVEAEPLEEGDFEEGAGGQETS